MIARFDLFSLATQVLGAVIVHEEKVAGARRHFISFFKRVTKETPTSLISIEIVKCNKI